MNAQRDFTARHPQSVYVRRRLLLIAALLALVTFVTLVIMKPKPDDSAVSGVPPQTSEKTDQTDSSAQQSQQHATGIASCATDELIVTPLTDRDSYASDELPMLSLRVEHTGAHPCQTQLGTAAMRFEISSGSDQVWRSTDCQVDADSRMVILEPNVPLETEPIAWNRTRSSPETCDIAREPVTASGATYHLHVAIDAAAGIGTAPFLLY